MPVGLHPRVQQCTRFLRARLRVTRNGLLPHPPSRLKVRLCARLALSVGVLVRVVVVLPEVLRLVLLVSVLMEVVVPLAALGSREVTLVWATILGPTRGKRRMLWTVGVL